jgi:hypothetical protein
VGRHSYTHLEISSFIDQFNTDLVGSLVFAKDEDHFVGLPYHGTIFLIKNVVIGTRQSCDGRVRLG